VAQIIETTPKHPYYQSFSLTKCSRKYARRFTSRLKITQMWSTFLPTVCNAHVANTCETSTQMRISTLRLLVIHVLRARGIICASRLLRIRSAKRRERALAASSTFTGHRGCYCRVDTRGIVILRKRGRAVTHATTGIPSHRRIGNNESLDFYNHRFTPLSNARISSCSGFKGQRRR
jgi:hypothetical protein